MRFKTAVICCVLGGTALSSHALNLGRARGAAWIGQSLTVTVPVQLQPGQSADALCAGADVFYADSKVEANRVQVSVDPNVQGETVTLRVQSSAIIDEPVVTLYVRAGCNNPSTRRYVLLADYASDLVPVTNPEAPVAAASPARQNIASTPGASPENGSAATERLPAPRTIAQTAPTEKPAETAKKKRAAVRDRASVATGSIAAPRSKLPAPRGARLQLDPLENLTERIKTLEATTTSAPLKELEQDSQRIQNLQDDVKALLTQAAKNEASLVALRERLEKAEAERIAGIWVAALLLLVAAGTAAAILFWNRRAPASWHSAVRHPRAKSATAPLPAELPEMDPADDWSHVPAQTQAATRSTPTKHQPRVTPEPLNLEPAEFQNSVYVSTASEVSNSDMMGFDHPRLLHTDLNPSAQLDLQQQAEFFVTLGNANTAIEVLEKRIRQNPTDCPLLYLLLLQIANQHNLKTDFRQYREEFMQHFNAEVPEFALFRQEGRRLEDYPELLAHITNLWPRSKVMDVIETCALYNPQSPMPDRFDMAAFQDLIVLHGMARSMAYHQSQATVSGTLYGEHISLDL